MANANMEMLSFGSSYKNTMWAHAFYANGVSFSIKQEGSPKSGNELMLPYLAADLDLPLKRGQDWLKMPDKSTVQTSERGVQVEYRRDLHKQGNVRTKNVER